MQCTSAASGILSGGVNTQWSRCYLAEMLIRGFFCHLRLSMPDYLRTMHISGGISVIKRDCLSGDRGYPAQHRLWIISETNKRLKSASALLIAISRCGACADDCTSCRLILCLVGRRSHGEHISGLSRRQHAAATATNHDETFCVVVVVGGGENCFRRGRRQHEPTRATGTHLTYGPWRQ